jgi:hypothetical protein
MPATPNNSHLLSQDETSLDDLARQVRAWVAEIRKACLTALDHAMNCGDALNAAQERVSTGWKKWLRENCRLAVSTAHLYQQLARHREEIEAEISRVPDLSLRAARKLITKTTSETTESEAEAASEASTELAPIVPQWLVAYNQASPEERTRGLASIDTADFLAVMPTGLRDELMSRVVRVGGSKTGEPDPRITRLLREVLSAIEIADQPKTGRAARAGQESAARTKLTETNQALRAIGRSFHELEVVLVPAKGRRPKQAA